MSKEEREFLDDLRTKSIEAAAEIMESLQRLKLLYDEITDDGSGTPMPRPRPGDFFYRLARFELEHAANVIRLGNSQAEMIFDHVRQLSRRTRGGAGGPSTTPVVTLQKTSDDKPNVYIGRFEIKNTFSEDADVRYEVAAFRSPDGSTHEHLRPTPTCGNGRVVAHRTAFVDLTIDLASHPNQTLFGEITVFLLADVERQVAKRAIKVRTQQETSGSRSAAP
ncbi:MAG: hypothetical protein ACKV2T_19465 [Kofleriaceae bacterium]